MITKPLDFQSRLSPPPRDLDFVAWVNVGLIALFFGLLGSRFILSPGMEMQLGGGAALELPTAGGSASATGAASVVVSYRRDNVILFEGGMYTLIGLQKQLETYIKEHPGSVMLVRCDKQVTVQALVELCDMVKLVGFSNVIVPIEPVVKEGLSN